MTAKCSKQCAVTSHHSVCGWSEKSCACLCCSLPKYDGNFIWGQMDICPCTQGILDLNNSKQIISPKLWILCICFSNIFWLHVRVGLLYNWTRAADINLVSQCPRSMNLMHWNAPDQWQKVARADCLSAVHTVSCSRSWLYDVAEAAAERLSEISIHADLHLAHVRDAVLPGILGSYDSHEAFASDAFLRNGHGPFVTKLVSHEEVVDVLHCMECRWR